MIKDKIMKRMFRTCLIAVLVLSFLLSAASCRGEAPVSVTNGEATEGATPMPSTAAGDLTPELADPHVVSTASLGVTGDILIHETLYNSVDRGNGVYDFTENYEFLAPYLQRYDWTVANLEVTLGGPNPVVGTYPSAYPSFNCPDSVADALKHAGVDMLLTANNHSYDTRKEGLLRTVQVLREKGIEYLGTRDTETESLYKVKEINGIRIGMACFTYSKLLGDGRKSLNGITVAADAGNLVSTFTYENKNAFYEEAQRAITAMKEQGAQFTVFYMHWGNEYQRTPNSHQKQLASKLCELGVDVIVGGHPHVIQPFETLTAANGNKTLCIYSTGNAISNQRKEIMDSDNYSGHTEDGMIFGVTFEKWSDGSYRIGGVTIEPTWVIREKRNTPEGYRFVYQIIPLDLAVADWKSFRLTDNTVNQAKESYRRTMKLVGEGINQARAALGQAPLVTALP
jgi:poly-gamma-glutamate synthesis protein (capsule biosynthesis protein)